MRIILNIYEDIKFGNCKIDSLILTTNRIPISFLKNIISQKYKIDKIAITLLSKMYNKYFVIMADNFPLYFYNIKNNSTIYVEVVKILKKNEDAVKKIKLRETKSKLLRNLNIFEKRPNMDIIKESPIEDLEIENNEINIKLEDNNDINNLNEIIKKRFTNSIINNKIDEFRDIMRHFKDNLNINNPIGKSQKYSPIHFVSMFGYSEMMEDLIFKYYADVNLISKDGWSPLHISSFKGNNSIISILIKIKKTKFNLILPQLGTPLHCSCKQNNLETVALLLYKSDPDIKNEEGVFPIELTSNKYIKKLITNIKTHQNENLNLDKCIENKIKIIDENEEKNKNNELEKYKFLKEIKNIPPCPSRYKGFCYKRSKRIYIYNLRYIEINSTKNLFLRYKSKEEYPFKPKEVIFLTKIKKCQIQKFSDKDDYFYIELIIDDSIQLLRFESITVCKIWEEKIRESIEYSKFWNDLKSKINQDEDYVQLYLSSLKQDIYEIDYLTGELRKYDYVEEIEKMKNKKSQIISKNYNNMNNNINIEKENMRIDTKNMNNNKIIDINCFKILHLNYTSNLFIIYDVKSKFDSKNNNNYIMKVFNKKNLIKTNQLKDFTFECNIQKQLISPFLLSIYHSFQRNDNLYFTLEDCPGYNLSFYKNRIIFDENDIKIFIAEIILAVEYIHKIEMTYMNLSLENILITKDNHIKLADLQLQKKINNIQNNISIITRKGIGISADIYSIGCILYELVCGMPPFFAINVDFKNKKKEEELYFPNYLSDDLNLYFLFKYKDNIYLKINLIIIFRINIYLFKDNFNVHLVAVDYFAGSGFLNFANGLRDYPID